MNAHTRRQPWKTAWKPLAGAAVLGLMIIYSTGSCRERTGGEVLSAQEGIPVPTGAGIITVEQIHASVPIEITGTTRSDRSVQLSARIAADILDILVVSGDRVEEGQALVRLDDGDIREQLVAAQAALNEAQSEYNRIKSLYERQAATEQMMVSAESAWKRARAELDRMNVMMSYTEIRSPMKGIITERMVDVGDLASPGQVLLRMYDPTDMRLEVPVPVRLLDRIEPGMTLPVRLDYPEADLSGTVKEVVSAIDPQTRSRLVKVGLPVAGMDLLPGTFGRLILPGTGRDMVVIPSSAVRRIGQIEQVFVVKDGRAERRFIRTAPFREADVQVLSGLNAGEQILIEPPAGRE